MSDPIRTLLQEQADRDASEAEVAYTIERVAEMDAAPDHGLRWWAFVGIAALIGVIAFAALA
ncbi:MAG: hypothetical protein A3E01_10000 [Gammaproteobacteria bacterium RIFCSPHIGHO2_12_FULL_63_22]|nr:MAG: hypothetical protein A3E01_10000 [Gammaproteobacteria bacterium RIFCSPHIGHO2_12_FULL_63_22]